MADEIGVRKSELRRRMNVLRRTIDDRAERSIRLWSNVRVEPSVRAARTIMLFDAMNGEPDASSFAQWCASVAKHVVIPAGKRDAAYPADPRSLDVVVVPGLAFTLHGDRLGQGAGWYDRLLDELRDDCVSIGVGFAEQIVDFVPTEPHDQRIDVIVTDQGRVTTI